MQDQDQDLNFKTKTFLWCILEADRKAFFSFSTVNEHADENEISFTAENETKTKMDIHFRPKKNENESHLIMLVFFFLFSYIQSPSQSYNAPPIPRPVSPFFCRWSLLTGFHFPHVQCTLWHFSRWHFNPWTVCFPGLLLPSESNFSQCTVLTGVCVA